jgi:ketosteroid isomerase-like protein
MSEKNVELFERGVEAWNRGDFDAWIQRFDPELEWHALLKVFRGHDGARQAWDSFRADVKLTVRFDDIRDLGESVLALGEAYAVGQRTGLNLKAELAQLATFRADRIVGFRDFASHAEALEATGLEP